MTNAEQATGSIARRHDLDALRAFAMLLGIVLHGALAFIPGAWAVTDASVEGDGTPFAWLTMAIHGFRMPVFFPDERLLHRDAVASARAGVAGAP